MMLCLLCSVVVYAQENTQPVQKLTGTWNYTAPDAPSGYEKGMITFILKENKLTGKAVIQGSEYNTSEIKPQGEGSYTTRMEVDGNQVEITLKPDAKTITALAVAGGMNIPVTLSKEKK